MKTIIEPTGILVSTKIDDVVIDRFDPGAKNGEPATSDNDRFRLPFLLNVRPPSEFYYDAARSRLMTLRLGEDDGTRMRFNVPGDHLSGFEDGGASGQQGQLIRLAGWIDLESRITVDRPSDCSLTANLRLRSDVQVHFFPTSSEGVLPHICLATMQHT